MTRRIRVVDCGGQGFRRADVFDFRVENVVEASGTLSVDELVLFAKTNLPKETSAIAYASAGVIENHRKIILSPNLHFLNNVNLARLTDKPGRPAIVCNDMEAAVTGMSLLFPDLKYFMGITWSTGIGIRFWKDGQILSESEGGHMCINPSPLANLCKCGRRGCAESILGGSAIMRDVVNTTKSPAHIHPCHWLDLCYINGETWAKDYYYSRVIIPNMALFLGNIQALMHLPVIIWRGTIGIKAFGDIVELEGLIRDQMKKNLIQPNWVDDLQFRFVPTEPKNVDSFLGAAEIARKMISR